MIGRLSSARRHGWTHVATFIAVACLGVGTASAQQPPAAPPAQTGVPVRVAEVKRANVPVVLRNIGAVQAFQSVLVRARVDGTLMKIFFTEGQDVKVGDKLAEIDPRPYAAVLAQVKAKKAADEAQVANAKQDLSRYSNLASRDFASRQQVDTQTSQVAQLTANLQADDAAIATAQLNFDFCNITSPIDGRVGLRLVDVGNLIHATDTTGIVTIAQVQPIAMIFTLPQDSLPEIRAAMAKSTLPVIASTADDKTVLGRGQLLTTDNTIDQGTGTIRLKAVFDNKDDTLWPGQFVNARLQVGTLSNAMTIPSIALQRGPENLFVYVVKPDSTVAVQPVDVGQDDGTVVVVTKGLDDGVKVVTNGQSRLQNGTRVAINAAPTGS
jgi:multidrug efflux system membrane fusion protein